MKTPKASDLVVVPRGPGRPKTVCTGQQHGSTVTVYLPTSYHDRLAQLAARRSDQSVSAVVREILILQLPTRVFSTDK